jgi:hypothetical protein
MLLTHLGVDFEDKMYPLGEYPDFAGRLDWRIEKPKLPMAFPNVPYIIDDDVKISENRAIMRFICHKYKPEYLGRTLQQQAACHEFYDITNNTKYNDVTQKLFPANYTDNVPTVLSARNYR